MSEQMHYWLVEQVHGSMLETEKIEHWGVAAPTAREAMQQVFDKEGVYLFFLPSELEVIIEDYHWAASDGSMVAVDVKKLDIPVCPACSQEHVYAKEL
jgi:hypothetical protein